MFVDEDDANLLPLCVHIVNGMHWIGEREMVGGWLIIAKGISITMQWMRGLSSPLAAVCPRKYPTGDIYN